LSRSLSRTMRNLVPLLVALMAAMMPTAGRAQDVPLDTAAVQRMPEARAAAKRTATDTTAYHPTKSPLKAMLFSAVLPGAGQFYNESYWKVPIVLGFGVYLLSNWLDNNRRYHDYRSQFEQSLLANPPDGDQVLLSTREFYKDQRDSFTWYLLIWYVVTLADAYVDASLYDFNVSSDLSLRTLPVLSPSQVRAVRLNVHIRF
jgi:hypothetical protein